MRFRRMSPWIFLAIVCFAFAWKWDLFENEITNSGRYERVSGMFVFHILALMAAIVSTTIMSQEVEQKTIVYLVTRPVARWKYMIFRYLACSLVVAGLSVLALLLTSVGSFGLSANDALMKDVAALVIGAFAYCSLFMLVGLLFNRAMIMCLLFAFGWETLVPNMPGQMGYLSINSYLQAIAGHASQSTDQTTSLLASTLGSNTITATTGYVAMIGLSIVLAALSGWWFGNFEYLPREDAE